MPVTKAQVKKVALAFPGALEKPSYGRPAFFIEKKFFTRLRDEDDSLVLIVDSIDERDMLIELDPATYHITAHYKDYPAVLARIAKLDAKMLRGLLERRWRKIAPKRLVRELVREMDGGAKPAAPAKKAARKLKARAAGKGRR